MSEREELLGSVAFIGVEAWIESVGGIKERWVAGV